MLKIKYAAAALALALVVPTLSAAQARTWYHHRHYVRTYHHHYHHHYYRGHYGNYSNRNEFACTLPKSSLAYEPCMNRR